MKQIFSSLLFAFLLLILFISGAHAEIFTNGGERISSDDLTTVLLQVTPADNQYVYFYSATCSSCAKVKEWLVGFHERNPDIVVEYHDIALLETKILFEEYRGRFNLQFPATPIIFIGDLVALQDVDSITTHFEPLAVSISELATTSDVSGSPTATVTPTITSPVISPPESGNELPILLILGAGLLDGINPCAFAVLVLLLGYLMSVDSRRKMVIGGLIYTAAVFIFYYLAGLLLAHSVQALEIAQYFSTFAGILSIVFGLVMIKGVVFPDKGPILAIPESQKGRIDRWMKKGTLPAIFVLGVLVGMFELPCTGGIYLAIISMIALQTEIAQGMFYLLIYNIAFILPLFIILVAVCYGMPPEKVNEWRLEKRFLLRLIVGIIMIILGIVILSGILH
jgi:cytochrome c biogenesis protein CcdA